MVWDPKSRGSSSEYANCSDSGYAPSSLSAPRRRHSTPLPLFPSLQSALRHPRILECLLSFIPYRDFNALTSSCSELRNLMQRPILKDAILSKFLPGFRSLLRSKAPELFVDVRATVGDLNIFHLSNKFGLHIYPLYALQFNTTSDEVLQPDLLRKLQCLTIVHSKFILLLQSLAHSSHQPVEPELENNSPPRSTIQMSPPGIKQLYFPEPLYYCASPAIHRTPSFHRHKRSQSAEIVTGDTKAPVKKRTLLSRSRRPPPPPSTDFLIRQSYFSPWRRILQSSCSITISEPATLPRRRRFLSTSNQSDSSLPNSTRLSVIQGKRGSILVPRLRIPHQSPHDIHLATSRSHAPILRVFVPCSELNDITIAACEDQLSDAGLWDHLSVGDIVCNLGYMPPPPPPPPECDFLEEPVTEPSSPGDGSATDDTVWLVYDGFGLVQYSPAVEPPPLKDALTLVTPYYYSHILPNSAHPFFTLDLHTRLSRIREFTNPFRGNTFPPPVPPKYELIPMLTKVRSPQSPGGYATVKRYKWIVTIKGIKATVSGDTEVGSGWLTDEWVLEVDGTLEGRRMLDSLLSAVDAHVKTEWARGDLVWEVDRQRSSSRKTWLRLLGNPEGYVLPLDPIPLSPTSPISAARFYSASLGPATGKRRQLSFMVR